MWPGSRARVDPCAFVGLVAVASVGFGAVPDGGAVRGAGVGGGGDVVALWVWPAGVGVGEDGGGEAVLAGWWW